MNATSRDSSFGDALARISRKVMRARPPLARSRPLHRSAHIALPPRPRCSIRYVRMGTVVPRITLRSELLCVRFPLGRPLATASPRRTRLRFSIPRAGSSTSSSSSSSESSSISITVGLHVLPTVRSVVDADADAAAAADAPVATERGFGCDRERFACIRVGSETGIRAADPSDDVPLTMLSRVGDIEEVVRVVMYTLSVPGLQRAASFRSPSLPIVTRSPSSSVGG